MSQHTIIQHIETLKVLIHYRNTHVDSLSPQELEESEQAIGLYLVWFNNIGIPLCIRTNDIWSLIEA